MFICQSAEYRPDSAVNVRKEEYQRKGNADKQYRALDKVRPEHRLKAACVGVDNGDHSHDDDQKVHADSRKAPQHHARKVHDNGHPAHLIDDEHDCTQNP